MIAPIQPPIPPANAAATTTVNTVVTIQAINSATAVGEGSGGANPLSALANGTTVQGFVVNRDAQSNPILRTAIGDLRVTSDVFLKTGSEVTIRVDNTLSSLARIVAVDGLTPQDYNNQMQAARSSLTRDTISPSGLQPLLNNTSATTPKADSSTANPVLQALVLKSQPATLAPSLLSSALTASQSGPVQALAQLAQLRAGTPLRLTVFDLKLPPVPISLGALPQSSKLDALLPQRSSPPALGTTQLQPSITPIGANTQASVQLAQVSSALPNPTISGNTVSSIILDDAAQPITTTTGVQSAQNTSTATVAEVTSQLTPLIKAPLIANLQTTKTSETLPLPLTQPNQPASYVATIKPEQPALAPSAPNQINASVIGHDADGANILHTPFATLKVYTSQPLPTGTMLVVTADTEVSAHGTAPVTLAEEQLAHSVPQSDAAIENVLAWMLSTNPLAASDLQLRLPNTQHKLASQLLFFIAALKGGNVSDLLGKKTIDALEKSAPELLARLRQEVAQAQIATVDSPLSHWTLYPLSMMVGHEMQHARLYVGKDPNGSSSAKSDSGRGQRFVLEVELSQLGSIQFDGFVRTNDGKKSFDLMVRSAQPLEASINKEIRSIFDTSAAITGLSGHLVFQAGKQHFVRPMADGKTRTSSEGLNTILA